MQKKVLIIEDSRASMAVLEHLLEKNDLVPVKAACLADAKEHLQFSSTPEYLCAVVDFNLPDAPSGEAIDFTIEAGIPTIVITGRLDEPTREAVLAKDVVDYIPKENAQVYEYLSRLLKRLEKNRSIGVLVVDDSRLARLMQVSLLERHNFTTYEAGDGEEGLNLLRQHNDIRLVITDENMPNKTGIEMVSEIRQTFSREDVAIIGISGKGSSALSARFIKSGANDYIAKPYCHEEFFCRVIQNIEHIENVEKIRTADKVDHLTGIPSRLHFFKRVDASLRLAPKTLAVALFDIDNFKAVNNQYGHQTGDKVLKSIAALLKEHFANFHYCRFGGEEFCVYFSGVALDEVVSRAERFREALEETQSLINGELVQCTVSAGISDVFSGDISETIRLADDNLTRAKQAGKNQVSPAV